LLKRLATGLALVGGALAGLGAINTWLGLRVRPLENTMPGSTRFYQWPRASELTNVFYKTVDDNGAPLVLVHGIDAAASSEEWSQVVGALAATNRVFVLDLPGFGYSDRPNRSYVATDYVDFLDDFLRDVVKEPAIVVASSLSAAHAVAVAARSPERISTLLLVCPTGLERLADAPETWQQQLGYLLRLPIVGSTMFNLLVSHRALGYFLRERTFADPAFVTPQIVEAFYRTSHQPGARFAPAAFVGGKLNLSIRETYPSLAQPVYIIWGREAQVTPVSDANLFIQSRHQTRLKVLDGCGLLPHVEKPEEFLAVVRGWLGPQST
jgi:pimeloyl-ACP methyl ester carboxylesterase